MAKWGEGDPRWLVEERPDATNVNNWHWTEKNAANWSKDKLKMILVGTKIETDFAKCKITEITKCEGDAVVNNRKGRLIVFYEWAIEMKWIGALINGDTKVKGTIEIPNLSEEHDMKDVDVNVHVETTGPEAEILKDMMRATGGEVIRRQLSQYVTFLKEEFSRGLILPTREREADSAPAAPPRLHLTGVAKFCEVKYHAKPPKLDLVEYKTTEVFKCTAEEFYRAMTVLDLVQSFTQGASYLDASQFGKFVLFDGNVTGYFVQLIENECIVQKWRFATWPENHHSEVRMDINQKADCTEVTITHTGIPKSELENTRNGWKRFYWDSLRRNLGFGALLF